MHNYAKDAYTHTHTHTGTHAHTHTVQTDGSEWQCGLTEIFWEEKCLEFTFEGRESSRVPEWSVKSWQHPPVATILVKGADASFQPLIPNRVFRMELIFRSLRCSYLGYIFQWNVNYETINKIKFKYIIYIYKLKKETVVQVFFILRNGQQSPDDFHQWPPSWWREQMPGSSRWQPTGSSGWSWSSGCWGACTWETCQSNVNYETINR